MNKSWLYVILTSIFELIWVFGFNTASVWWHWLIIVFVILIDFHFMSKACENLPTGTVYAIFAGAGTTGAALMDVFFFGGHLNIGKIIFIGIIITGVVGLKLAHNNETEGVA
ncbi:DMT family transporter [Metabacillus fastidiosus]|uniref:DMT family transporter n=1 Tax=Metabacillus fastidiosus TaxID=1458 RepID=UPI002E1BCF65|nr:SMR family transporter [Metabacillus fastidiosus]MED4452262.1 SMR family transporter [Metabacillus fastidiosus]